VVTEDLKFMADGWRHVGELNATNNALLRSYIWGLDLSESPNGAGGVGGLLMLNSVASGAHFYAYDGNGNVAALVRATNGAMSAVYEYDPFGSLLRATGAMADENRFQFSTKRCDRTTDFQLYEFRVRRPELAWLSRDPLNEEDGPNIYGFVQNTPPNLVDRDGLESWGSYLDRQGNWISPHGLPKPQPAPPPAPPARVPSIPAELTRCCDAKALSEGERELNKRFNQASFVAARLGLKPVRPRKYGATCKASSRDILAFLAPFPKCWQCYLEERDRYPNDITDTYSDHQAVICIGYEAGAVKSREIIFDWWGDVKYRLNRSGGSPDWFRNEYRYAGLPSYDELTSSLTDCDGKVAKPPPENPCFECSRVSSPK
jgi:RHS repeat-associated protein